MSRLADKFALIRQQGRKALMPYLTAGDPDLDFTYAAALTCVAAGADMLELGIPFSDPLADGPVIQAAAKRALDNGVTFPGVMSLIARLRETTDVPIVLLVYYNTVYNQGEQQFMQACHQAGVGGVVVADLPADENATLAAAARAVDLDLIHLVAPTSTSAHISQVGRVATGFIYCVSVAGVTGARTSLPATLSSFLQRVRSVADAPLMVGFGVSQPEQAVQAAQLADGIIVGSALVDLLARKVVLSQSQAIQSAAMYISSIRRALDSHVYQASYPNRS